MYCFNLRAVSLVCILSILSTSSAYAILAHNDKALLGQISNQMKAGQYDRAVQNRNKLENKAAQNYVYWKYLTAKNTIPSYSELDSYMDNNPNMPHQNILQSKLENTLSQVDTVMQAKFFAHHSPITTQGRISHIHFLLTNNQKPQAIQVLKKLWHHETLSYTQQAKIIRDYGTYLSVADYSERIKNLLDTNQATLARDLLKYATPNDTLKYNLRRKLTVFSHDALGAYRNASYAVKQDAGVLRSLVRYYRKTNQENAAINVMAQLTSAQSADNPQAWHESRNVLSRVAFKAGQKQSAYKIIANHFLTEGGNYVDAEFYAGWLALRHLGHQQTALTHFKNGRTKSSLPISISRFEYWIGRACNSLKNISCEKTAYTNASKYFYTFYGQLAGHAIGLKHINIPKFPQPDTRITSAYFNDSVIQASYAATAFGNDSDTTLMLTSVAERIGKNPAIYPLLEKSAKELGNLKARVKLSKSASVNNDFLIDTGYPIINIRNNGSTPELALLHALTRQESEFDQYAQSPVGARGMMQLMPSTAQHTARKMGVPYQLSYLTQRPDYNMTLGGFFLNQLINQFNGSYIHALSGYNAGPGRIGQWNNSYGRFTPDLYHIIDRIETIPFSETRNYIQRILENVQVYRAKMAGTSYISTENLVQDLKRGL